jgi:hypothetical protein
MRVEQYLVERDPLTSGRVLATVSEIDFSRTALA